VTSPVPSAARGAIRVLSLDAAAADLVRQFRARDVPSLLLKGPVLASWLYDGSAMRTYVDIDVLVPPAALERAQACLGALGFGRLPLDAIRDDWPRHALVFRRADGITVDLHQTLMGVGVSPDLLWSLLWSGREPMVLCGVTVDAIGVDARTLLVALHAAKDGGRVRKVSVDLERAIERVPDDGWRRALEMARQLDATATFAGGLRRVPAGEVLADRLGLPERATVDLVLRQHGAPPLATGLDWLVTSPGFRGKPTLIVRKLFPPPSFLRDWSPLARRGWAGLAAAYVWRPLWALGRSVPAVVAVARAHRAARWAGGGR
jgi:hypothetical protein